MVADGLPPAALAAHRAAVERAFNLDDGGVLIPSGLRVPVPGTDASHEFRVHADHYYLSGLTEPGQVLAFDPDEGWTVFARVPGVEDRVWEGNPPGLDEIAARSGIGRVFPREALSAWVEAYRESGVFILGNRDLVARPAEYGVGDWAKLWVPSGREMEGELEAAVWDARRRKSRWEIEIMRRSADACAAGHAAAMRIAKPGMTERELGVEIDATFRRAGALRPAYDTIVAAGTNGAVLHHHTGDRALGKGDLVVVDAGAELGGYMSDVTRTFPAGGRFTPMQREIYDLVLAVQEKAVTRVRPGMEYRELHLAVCHAIAAGLRNLGVLRGDPDSLVERDVHALFFPHGLGHMIGLSTHDVGGYQKGRERSDRFGLKWLRTDLPLEPGHVVTIEPGIYFIPALLKDPERRHRFADCVVWEEVDRRMGLGGVRIEDDVVVTGGDPEVLTAAIPKRAADVEAACGG